MKQFLHSIHRNHCFSYKISTKSRDPSKISEKMTLEMTWDKDAKNEKLSLQFALILWN